MRGPLVVVGDTLLDIDLCGRAKRLSPDAPVPVLDSLVESARPGGAGLAAELAARDGHEVVLVTALGDDPAGRRLAELLSRRVRLVRLPFDGETPVKQRVRAGGQSLLRLDSGDRPGVVRPTERDLRLVADAVDDAGAVLVSDYGRGITSVRSLRTLLASTRSPVVWDPHPRGAVPVDGARLVTPNRDEAARFAVRAGLDVEDRHGDEPGLGVLGRQAACLVRTWRAHSVAITLGARGALLSHGEAAPALVPSPSVPCPDPCGAGDRFAVAAAVALGQGAVTSEAVHAAVASAADFVAAGGAAALGTSAPSAWAGLSGRGRPDTERAVVVATGGCFDLLHAGHVATLRAARELGDRLVVCLNSDASVRRLKGPTRPLVPAEDRARVLEALEYVDEVVVFDEDTPVEVLRRIRPDVWAKGGDYAGTDVPEAAVLGEWGGQAVILPYLDGRSTTRLVATAASAPRSG